LAATLARESPSSVALLPALSVNIAPLAVLVALAIKA
jgi:hypothetical protein